MGTNTKECIWQKIRENIFKHLADMQFSKSRLSDYNRIFNKLEKFMQRRSENSYSARIGEAFTKEMSNTLGSVSLKRIKTVIRRLNDFLAEGKFALRASEQKPKLPKPFQEHLDGYIEFSKLHGLRESTIARYVDYCRKALLFFWERNIHKLSDITTRDVNNVFMSSKDKSSLSKSLRSFFRFLYRFGIHSIDLSLSVPSVRRPQVLPSTYTKEEMFRLLSSVDRSTAMGKRDYLIILLARKLGMRSGDIAKLKYGDIDFRARTIDFIQEKTLMPHRLELLPEIEEALLECLKARRPGCDCEYIFLRAVPPYIRITSDVVSNIVRKAFKESGICIAGKKHGPHSLRMTLASELVSENVPYMVVGKILGHEDPDVAKHYVKFDIEMLRACALEVPQLSGVIAEKLSIFERGSSDELYI
jgi:integrase